MGIEKVTIKGATLYHGDCMEVMADLEPISLVCTDPPYLLDSKGGGGCFGDRKSLLDTKGFTDGGCDYSFLDSFDNWFVFCSRKQLKDLIIRAEKCHRWNLITWCKPNPVPTCNNKYLPDVEYIIHGFGKGKLYGGMKIKASFIQYPCGNKETIHPNEKPIAVIDKLILLGSQQNETILDPFMGSGSTGVACANLQRKFIGIEKERKYFDIACERIERAYSQGHLFNAD